MIADAPPAYIIDGDTFRAAGQTYRIVGLNTPELRSKCNRETELALRAKARLRELWPGATWVRVNCAQGPLDKYGRMCAQVTVQWGGLRKDWAHVAHLEGLAELYDCPRGRCPQRKDWCQ